MADITNPEAKKFVNEQIRPLAEEARAIKAKIDAATTTWYGGMNAKFPNDSSPVVDNREGEGISRLVGSDINSVMSVLIGASTALNSEIIAKPCVRPLQAS